ncbi:MAG: hypothetical protein Ct9H300mP7_1290 [Verrucomicrobiota bacterium]|nr:MAG: hypothetical protein Ct9H300mP7_1290 [Verrucomicrobiota bacterium]
MRKAKLAREALREIPIKDLVEMMKKAAIYTSTPPCRWAMVSSHRMTSRGSSRLHRAAGTHVQVQQGKKNHFVLNNMDQILDALTRGLDIDILQRALAWRSAEFR